VTPLFGKALALGGEEAIRVNATSDDSYYIAAQIAEVAKQNSYDLVLTGKETIDYNASSVGGMVAELLDMPYISLATKLEINGAVAMVTREIEGGEEVDEVQLPVVVSCQKGVAEQRIPNMRGIMAARTKPLKVVEPANVGTLDKGDELRIAAGQGGRKIGSFR
jgi:electron transfer flavoprotein beta subunit